MRRQYFYWTYLVIAILLTVYGGYLLIYNLDQGKGVSILCLVCLIIGVVMLITYLTLFLIKWSKKKKAKEAASIEIEKDEEEPQVEAPKEEKIPAKPQQKADDVVYVSNRKSTYERKERPASRYREGTAYIKKVGYGPILRVDGNRFLDMRTNTYYRLEGNNVFQEGSGPVFEIHGNKIRSAFGSYLYEISGGSINKIFGGFYASISGHYIPLYDSSEKYEMSDDLDKTQILVVAALIFGSY